MLLVFLSHFSDVYLRPVGAEDLLEAIHLLTRVATPAFVLLSGMLLGHLRHHNLATPAATRAKLIDRGLFLLFVCHPLFVLAMSPIAHSLSRASRIVFVTDAIGVSLILAATIGWRITLQWRALIGGLLLALSWFIVIAWEPRQSAIGVVEEVIFGRLRSQVLEYSFPIGPWFGLYLVGSAVGELFADWQRKQPSRMFRLVAVLASSNWAILALVKLAASLLKQGDSLRFNSIAERFVATTSVSQKVPPGIGYTLFYSGLGLSMIAIMIAAERRNLLSSYLNRAALIGRNSLVAFVLQYFVYFVVIFGLPRPPLFIGPLYFVVTVLALYRVLAYCDAHHFNRLLTVGYRRWASRATLTSHQDA